MVIFSMYDYFTIPFNSVLITLLLGIILYCFTKSQTLFVTVLLVPQFIRFINGVILGKKENFMNINPQEVVANLQKMKENKSMEQFTDLKEVSNRVVNLKESKVPKVEEVSGLVDSIAFLEQFENKTDLTENTRIMTVPENAVPAIGTVERNARAVSTVEPFDSQSINAALVRSVNNVKPASSNLESVQV